MTYSSEIESLKKIISQLEEIREMMYQAERRVVSLEKAVCSIDETLPDDEFIQTMKPGKQKDSVMKALDLAKEAYDLVDEILGPPEQFSEDLLDEQVIMPQARGNDAISLEAALRKFNPGNPGGKNTAS